MATLECRRGNYRVIFYAAGERFSRSLKTKRRREAADAVARLEDNLRRVELGILAPPADADLPAFLLSDGRVTARLEVPEIRTLQALFENYFRAIPAGSLEENTRRGMQTHVKHLQRILGRHANGAAPSHSRPSKAMADQRRQRASPAIAQ